jgi:hypothetical protein
VSGLEATCERLQAVLGFYEDSVRPLVVQWRGRVPRVPRRRRLQWLKVPLMQGSFEAGPGRWPSLGCGVGRAADGAATVAG